MNNFEVMTEEVFTVKELEPGDLYIHCRDVKKYADRPKLLWRLARQRDTDPFFSLTLLGTPTHEFPSEKVYRVRRIDDG